MVKKLLILSFTSAFAFPLSTLMIAQDAPMKAAKEAGPVIDSLQRVTAPATISRACSSPVVLASTSAPSPFFLLAS
jgi:hypothetical protein